MASALLAPPRARRPVPVAVDDDLTDAEVRAEVEALEKDRVIGLAARARYLGQFPAYGEPPPPAGPAPEQPAAERVEVMRQRHERGEGLWHPADGALTDREPKRPGWKPPTATVRDEAAAAWLKRWEGSLGGFSDL